MTYPDAFSIILLYILYISIVVQSKLHTDHFEKKRKKKKKKKKQQQKNNRQNKEKFFKINNKTIRTAKIALI